MPAEGLRCETPSPASPALAAAREERHIRNRVDLRLYAVLDPSLSRGLPLASLATAAAQGGVTLLQLRIKGGSTRDWVAAAREVKRALEGTAVPLVINDRVDVALAVGAGAHVGQEDMAPQDARRLLGPRAILGATVHHPADAKALPVGLVDYVGLGPVFRTASKVTDDPPLGPDGLARLIRVVDGHHPGLPCCGIAGIDHRNAGAVIAAGAQGVAAISDIFMADDVTAAAARLRAAVDMALAVRAAA